MNEGAFRLGIERGRCMPTHFTRGRMAFGLCLLSARSATPNSSAHALFRLFSCVHRLFRRLP